MPITAKACPIEIRVVDRAQNNRPALAMPDASFVTVHEVGNMSPGADEEMHARFVHNGGGEHKVSFHFIVGPTKAIQLIYLNENAWHASDNYSGRGNRDSIAIETVQVGDFDKTLAHLAYLIAELYRNPTRFAWRSDVPRTDDLDPALAIERTKQHNFWAPDHKNCPQFIRGRGLWLTLLTAVATELAPVTTADVVQFVAPKVPLWWSEKAVQQLGNHSEAGVKYRPLGTRITATSQTGAYAHPWDPALRGFKTRPDIVEGETVDLRYVATHPTRSTPWGLLKTGSWVSLQKFTPRFTIAHTR